MRKRRRISLSRMRRNRWLKRRAKRNHYRPRSVRLGMVNLDSATAGRDHARRVLRRAIREGNADVLAICEANKLNVADELGHRWEVVQSWPGWNNPRGGCALAVDRRRVNVQAFRIRKGCGVWLRGRRARMMRERFWIDARLRIDPGTSRAWTLRHATIHLPPSRNWFLTPQYMARVNRRRPDVIAGDWNMRPRRVRRFTSKALRLGGGIIGFAVRRRIPTSHIRKRGVGGDHVYVEVTLW